MQISKKKFEKHLQNFHNRRENKLIWHYLSYCFLFVYSEIIMNKMTCENKNNHEQPENDLCQKVSININYSGGHLMVFLTI
jgi:hypothetical protein